MRIFIVPFVTMCVLGPGIVSTETASAATECATPVSGGSSPTASDCLFILRSAIGSVVCEPECACDPSGDTAVTASDALLCLAKAVGQNVELACPCASVTSTSSTTTTTVEPVPLECEIAGFPCAWSDVAPATAQRTFELAADVHDLLAGGAAPAEARAYLDEQADVAEVDSGPFAIRFRVDGGRAVWLLTEEGTLPAPAEQTAATASNSPAPLAREAAAIPAAKSVVGRSSNRKRATVLSPFNYFYKNFDNTAGIAALLRQTRGYEGGTVRYLANETRSAGTVSVASFAQLGGREVIYFFGHGGRVCMGDEGDDCRAVVGAQPLLGDPEALLLRTEKGLEWMITLEGESIIGLAADYFRNVYPNGLGRSVIALFGCYVADTDLHEAIQGPTSAFLGWHGPVSPLTAGPIGDRLFAGLAEGRAVGEVYESMGEAVADPHGGGRLADFAPPAGGDLRIREIVTLRDPSTGLEITPTTQLAIDGETDDGEPDGVIFLVDVDGVAAQQLGNFPVQVTVDGVSGEVMEVATGEQIGLHKWRLTGGVLLPGDLHEGQTVSLWGFAQLPDQGISEHVVSPTVTGPGTEPFDVGQEWRGETRRVAPTFLAGVWVMQETTVTWLRDPDQADDEDVIFHPSGGESVWTYFGTTGSGCRYEAPPTVLAVETSEDNYLEFDRSSDPVTYRGSARIDNGPMVPLRISCPDMDDVVTSTKAGGGWFLAPPDEGLTVTTSATFSGFYSAGGVLSSSFEWTFDKVR